MTGIRKSDDGGGAARRMISILIAVVLLLSTPAVDRSTATAQGIYGGRSRDTNVPKEYCEWERFRPNCSHGEVVVMRSAVYGRMRIGRCVEAGLGFLGCSTDVLRLADAKCSGRQSCEISIPDKDFDATRPCYKELKVYLEASYTCMRVTDADRGCTIQLSATGSTGLATYVVSSTGPPPQPSSPSTADFGADPAGPTPRCGTLSQPWIIEAEPGQKLNISLIDFGTASSTTSKAERQQQQPDNDDGPFAAQAAASAVTTHNGGGGGGGDDDDIMTCPFVYGFVFDGQPTAALDRRNNISICGGRRQRDRAVHQTSGHVAYVVTSLGSDSANGAKYFVLRFEAVGCADLRPPHDSWLKRDGDDLAVGCHSTPQTWHLKCERRRWNGVIGNCTSNGANARNEALVNMHDFTLPHLLTIATVVLISLTLSFFIVCVGVICFRRFAREERARKQQYAVIAADKLYSDVTSGLDDSSMAAYSKSIVGGDASGSLMTSSMADYPPHIWQLPLPPPGGETFLTTTARCHPELTDYSVGSMDSRYFVLDHSHGNESDVVISCHGNQ